MSDNKGVFANVKRGGGAYWKPAAIGDQITGTITQVAEVPNFDGTAFIPELRLDTDDGERIVQASQANLIHEIVNLDPEPKPGDKIRITFTSTEPTAKGSPKKIFTVEHKVGEPVKSEDIF